jgi:hypothetical protein
MSKYKGIPSVWKPQNGKRELEGRSAKTPGLDVLSGQELLTQRISLLTRLGIVASVFLSQRIGNLDAHSVKVVRGVDV